MQFIQDNTVFRGKERADGMPISPGAFVAININNTSPTTVMDFAADTANDAQLIDLAVGTESLTFNQTTYSYTIAAAANASDKIEATPSPVSYTHLCCQSCTARHPACHDTCEVYCQQKRIQEADKETRRKNSAPDRQIYQHKAETIRKVKR